MKVKSLFLPWAQLMQKLVNNLTTFYQSLFYPWIWNYLNGESRPSCGVSIFIPPLFLVTMTHALFWQDLSKEFTGMSPFSYHHSLSMVFLYCQRASIALTESPWCHRPCSAANEHPYPWRHYLHTLSYFALIWCNWFYFGKMTWVSGRGGCMLFEKWYS